MYEDVLYCALGINTVKAIGVLNTSYYVHAYDCMWGSQCGAHNDVGTGRPDLRVCDVVHMVCGGEVVVVLMRLLRRKLSSVLLKETVFTCVRRDVISGMGGNKSRSVW